MSVTATVERPAIPPEIAARLARIAARPVVCDIQRLGKAFPTPAGEVTALRDVSFQVRRREFITVIGASGCGKSTLARIVAGLEPASSGRILCDGRPITGPSRDCGMVFQGYTLFPWLTVLGNVMFGLTIGGMGRMQAESEARQWLELVGLDAAADSYPHQLSGGMKQRVAIARALANQPKLLLMDEPFGALDAQTRATLQHHLQQIWLNVNLTVLFITHDLDEAVLLADRIVVLGANPSRLMDIVEVPLPAHRPPAILLDPAFLATRRYIESLIHQRHATSEIKPLPLVRMTQVGDDVL
jgi:NitT/TauT family transport system ATP-binding protein